MAKKQSDADLLKEAKKRLKAAFEHDRDNREEAIKDLKFLALDQWPEKVRRQREIEGRPCLTLDQLVQIVNQVSNDIRQAKIAVKAVGVDDKTDPGLADVFSGLMRDIQYQSCADYVYALAAEGAVSCGIGHMRIDTAYVDDAVFDQEIKIAHIPYPLSVYWDPASVLPDRSDAMWCFVCEFIPEITFEDKYPKASKVDVEVTSDNESNRGLYWATKDGVLVAEYIRKVPVTRTLAAFPDGTTLDITDLDEDELKFLPPPVGEREVKTYKVEHALITGKEVLEGPDKLATRYIPIIPVIGSEVHLERKVIRKSLIRGARDGQLFYNYQMSSAAEAVGLAPKAKWLLTDTMIEQYKGEWDTANISPKPYLRYKPDQGAPGAKPERIAAPETPAALWQGAAQVKEDIKAATGIYNASLGAQSNETSGVAIARRQNEGDVGNYHFSDNLTRSLQQVGRILIDMIPRIYDTQRVVRLMGEDDEHDFVPINAAVMGVDGEPVLLNDLSKGKFDVRVSIGPSYTTQRLEAADSMLQYIKADPQALPLIRDIFVKQMDWPGAEQIAERFKHTIPPQVLGADEQPEPPAQQPPPDPQAQLVNQLQLRAAGAKIAKTEGDAEKAHAEADKTKLENQLTVEELKAIQAAKAFAAFKPLQTYQVAPQT